MKVTCFSSFTFSYLDRARVLFRSVRRYHPEWRLVALITDIPPVASTFDPLDEPFDEIKYANDLEIPNFSSWLFKHDIVEVCTAVKGAFLRQACDSQADVLIYLDPDTCLFDRLDPVLELLKSNDIVLTPHLLSPEITAQAILDNEVSALKTGIYNLGFLAIRTTGEGLRFAEWWRDRLLSFCYDDIPSGLFVDQRWCDHTPALFASVHILRDPGYNVASWNIAHRRVAIDKDGRIFVNGYPLRFWHFTKLGPVGDTMTKKYAGDNFEVYELWRWYKRQVSDAHLVGLPSSYWAYSEFDDGRKIDKSYRLLYRNRVDLQSAFLDPFRSGPGSFQAWLEQEGRLEKTTLSMA